jgi:hypothetical protein
VHTVCTNKYLSICEKSSCILKFQVLELVHNSLPPTRYSVSSRLHIEMSSGAKYRTAGENRAAQRQCGAPATEN